MKVRFVQKGNFSELKRFLMRAAYGAKFDFLDRYGQMGVEALEAATPVDTGNTAGSWTYEIEETSKGATLEFHNTNMNDGVNIAVILEYGHGTRNGGWVSGRNYINPVIQPLFDEIAEDAWKEAIRE